MSHTYFDHNKNLQINGDINFIASADNAGLAQHDPSFFAVTQRVQATNAQSRAIDQGMKILCDNTAPSARYGYGHSFKGPQCHPGTRVAVQDHVLKWFNDEDGQIAMWMHGPVGIGKSAIAQTVAHLAAERDQLSSAFFFFRSDNARNTAKHLVATLAYEMTQQMPPTSDYVCQEIASNHLIFTSPLEHQIKNTLLRPARRTSRSSPQRRLVIIDGLDECPDIHMQQAIIRSFISTFLSVGTDTIPHRILIASRPESHIASVFSAADISSHVKRLPLDSWDMEDDIRVFLRAKLDEIQQTHPLKRYLPDVWPDEEMFCDLLHRSVGSFAYASIAIRHLSSHNNNPKHALHDLLSLQPTQVAAAFADVDALYRHILVSLDPKLRFILQKVLCLHFYSDGHNPTIEAFAAGLLEDCSTIELALIRVPSLIKIDQQSGRVESYHSSFEEFLWDEARAGDLYVFSPCVVSAVAAALSNLWLHPISSNQLAYDWLTNSGQFHTDTDPMMDMTRQLLNTLVETKLPTSFLCPSTYGTLAEDSKLDFYPVLNFCQSLHRGVYWPWESHRLPPQNWDSDMALSNQAFDVVCAWIQSHFSIFFQGAPTIKNIIAFLLDDYWYSIGQPTYESPSLRIFRYLVKKEDKSLLCMSRVFPNFEYLDICLVILKQYLELPSDIRNTDIEKSDWDKDWYLGSPGPSDWRRECSVTLSQLYCRILYQDNPTIPSICQILEQIVAVQTASDSVIGSLLTPRDYIFAFFYGDRCYIDSNNRLAIGVDKLEVDDLPIRMLLKCSKLAELTDLYIQRAHTENTFAYISVDVETIYKDRELTTTSTYTFNFVAPA